MRMDAPSDGGLALTKDEQDELSQHGYGDLRDLLWRVRSAPVMPLSW